MALLGCFTGFMAGLLGIGGGMIITPFLIMLIPSSLIPHEHIVHVAIATSLATIAFTSLSSVRAHHKRGAVLWNVVASVAPGILVGAVVGAQIAGWLPTFWLSLIFAAFVGFSAFKMFLNKSPRPDRNLPGTIGKFFMGIAIGILSALVGAGGGFISVPWMIWCNVKCRMPWQPVLLSVSLSRSSAPSATSSAVGTYRVCLPGRLTWATFVFLPCSPLRLPVCCLHRSEQKSLTLSTQNRSRRSLPACCASSAFT